MADKRIPSARIKEVWTDPRLTTAQAARAVGLARSNLWLRAKALGLPPRPVGTRPKIIGDAAMFRRAWDAGVSVRAMAARFGCAYDTVTRNAKRLGCAPRFPGFVPAFRRFEDFLNAEAESRLAAAMKRAAEAERAAAAVRARAI